MDTVVYKLHNTERYPIILKAIQEIENGKGLMSIPATEFAHKETKFSKLWFNVKMDTYIIWSHIAKTELPSGASGVNIMYDRQRDYIKFELSLPKFFFGNNVIELIPPFQSKHYNSNHSMLHLCARYWYKLLRAVFYKIIQDVTRNMGANFSWSDVEVSRIDITFNQIFDGKDDALRYFEIAKKAKVPRLSDGTNKDYYDTSVTFLSKGNYYFKCYHKGTEFDKVSKHQITKTFDSYQRRKLLNQDSIIGHAMRHKDDLQDYSDKLLRYELECKNGLLNQLFKAHLMKSKMPRYKQLRKIFEYIFHERNYNIKRSLKIYYKDALGQFRTNPPKLGQFEKVYMLPGYLLKRTKDESLTTVENERTIKRINKILSAYTLLANKYGLHSMKEIKQAYKIYRQDKDTSFSFFFELGDWNKEEQRETPIKDAAKAVEYSDVKSGGVAMDLLEETHRKQRFSLALLQLCILKHNQLFQKLQCEVLPQLDNFEMLVQEYNKTNKPKINPLHARMIMANLQNMTWNEIKESGQFKSRTTLHNWKRKIEKLLNCSKDINFIEGMDLQTVSRTPSNMYFRHYDNMILDNSIISSFIQKSKILLSI